MKTAATTIVAPTIREAKRDTRGAQALTGGFGVDDRPGDK